jgi:hypothetical protein
VDTARLLNHGIQEFYDRRYRNALNALESVRAADPNEALAVYFLALIRRRMGQNDHAARELAHAVRLERFRRVERWGARMERIQGRERFWIEEARLGSSPVLDPARPVSRPSPGQPLVRKASPAPPAPCLCPRQVRVCRPVGQATRR